MLPIFRREPVLQRVPVAVLSAVLLGSIASHVLGRLVEVSLPESPGVLGIGGGAPDGNPEDRFAIRAYVVVLLTALQALMLGALRSFPLATRVFEHERALPLRPERVLFERLGALWIALWATALAAWTTLALWVPECNTVFLRVAGGVVIACTWVVLLLAAYRPRRPRLVGLEILAVWGSAFAAAGVVGRVSLTWPGVALAITVGLGAWAVRPLLTRRSTELQPAGLGAPGSWSDSLGLRIFGPLRWLILRSAVLQPPFLFLVFFALFFFLTGTDPLYPVMLLPMMHTHVSVGVVRAWQRMRGLHALPLAPERLLRAATLPSLLVLVTAFIVHGGIRPDWPRWNVLSRNVRVDAVTEETFSEKLEHMPQLGIPPTHWRLALRSENARLVAPWGEAFDPTPHPVLPGISLFAYNPYDIGPQSTLSFFVWQLSRALLDVHGVSLQPEAIRESWFPRWEVAAPMESLSIDWSYRGALRKESLEDVSTSVQTALQAGHVRTNPAVIYVAALAALVLWFLCCREALEQLVAPSRSGKRSFARWTIVNVGLMAGVVVAFILAIFDSAIVPVLLASMTRAFDALLLGSWLLWALFLGAALWGCDRALTARLADIDISSLPPPRRVRGRRSSQ